MTARLLNAVARIGFGTEVLAGRLAGEDQPSPRTIARAAPWRNVASALAYVRDIGDPEFPTYAREANLAADWIRDHARRWPDTAAGLPDNLEPLQRLLAGLTAHSIQPWRQALIDGRILTATINRLSDSHHNGIRHAELAWSKAVPLDRQGRDVLYCLADAAAHPTWIGAARTQAFRMRREEAIAGHGPNAERLQQRRARLKIAAQAHDDALKTHRAAASTHERLQTLRSDRQYTQARPRTAAQKDIRQRVDALERELAHQQQRWEIARARAAQLAEAAQVPIGQDPREALQRLDDHWSAAVNSAVANDIQASTSPDVRPVRDHRSAVEERPTTQTATAVHIGAPAQSDGPTATGNSVGSASNAATVRHQSQQTVVENVI